MSIEKRAGGNPKESPEFLAWKKGIVSKYKTQGIDIGSDKEYFVLKLKDKNGKQFESLIHAFATIPLVIDAEKNEFRNVPIEDIIEAEASFASNYSSENLPSMKLLLDQLAIKRKEKKRKINND